MNIFPEQDVPGKILYSVGLHPWHVSENILERDLGLVEEKGKNAVAIGECGLDRVCKVPFETQRRAFRIQVGIAVRLQKPIIIHCVRAYPDIIAEKKRCSAGIKWIVHGFRGNSEIAAQMLDHGFYLSFGGALMNDVKLSELLHELPPGQIFLETDDKAIGIREVYGKAALAMNLSFDMLSTRISENANRVFNMSLF
ncbi:MAG: TatD family hydrolase [Victivallales bacterium]